MNTYKDNVLIITSKDDAHADHIIKLFNSKGLGDKIIRLNTEDFVNNCVVSFDGRKFEILIKDSNRKVLSEKIKSVWYRRPKDFKIIEEDPYVRDYIKMQTTAFLRGIYFCCHDSSLWVNPLTSLHRSRHKLQQIQLATLIGFNTPKTMVTNDWNKAYIFARKVKKVCIKSLDEPNFVLDGHLYPFFTHIVDKSDIYNNKESITKCPVLFQEYIEKLFDIRVIIIGNDIFAFEIHSQENALSVQDFRGVAPKFIKHQPHNLPEEIKQKIRTFMARQGLFFSAMDLVLSKEKKYYFLENNPNGQWLWLEQLTNVPLSNSMIKLLFGN